MDLHEGSSLRTVRQYVRDGLAEGVECPCCHQYAKLYQRKLNSGMAIRLIFAWSSAHYDPFNLRGVLMKHPGYGNPVDFALLRFWGLIQECDSAGVWQITNAGANFVRNWMRTPKYIQHFNNDIIGDPYGEPVSISDALGDHFDYNELMGIDPNQGSLL